MRRERADERTAAAAVRTQAGRNLPGPRRWRRLRRAVGSWLLLTLAPWLVRLLASTWRVRYSGPGHPLQRSRSQWLAAMWHGRMLALMPLRHHRGRWLGVLVSPSDDGSLAAVALRHFRYRIVRGSLSRGGSAALRSMQDLLDHGGQLVITPDGPRGPRHTMNVGLAWLSRATGAPILPVACAVDRAWRLGSWDRFVVPKPFARVHVHYGEPILVPADADDAVLEVVAAGLRQRLLAAERDAFAQLGVPDDLGP